MFGRVLYVDAMCRRPKLIVWCLFLMYNNLCFAQDFGYRGHLAPDYWANNYEQCLGKHQSPINIEEHNVEAVDFFPLRFENFEWFPDYITVKNNGHTAVCTVTTDYTPKISGGPLMGKYELVQFHFHWGAHNWEGSENTLNNRSFPMELHLVFFSASYGSYQEAIDHPDGLTVLSFLFSNSDTDNHKYKPLIEALTSVVTIHSTATINQPPPLSEFLNEDRSVYYTYGGSLTTPPCSEIVTWIEFKHTIPISHAQIRKFRSLHGTQGKLLHNFRPTQPLYGRVIRTNRDMVNSAFVSTPHKLLFILLLVQIYVSINF